MSTTKLKQFARLARTDLIRTIRGKLSAVMDINSAARREAPRSVTKLQQAIKQRGEDSVVDAVAYTWFNRLCALRYMDVKGYSGSTRIVSPAPGQTQPEILANAKAGVINGTLVPQESRRNRIFGLLQGTITSPDAQTEAYKLLLVSVCNSLAQRMPFLFQEIDDYTELLMPDDLLSNNSIIARVQEAISEVSAANGVEIIGWLYQHYVSEKKEKIISAKIAYKTEDIPAATELFTPDWIVRYLVQNSLGRLWMLNNPDSTLADSMEYYIPPTEQDTDFLKIDSPEDIRICDPCCGSGHMLTYAFDLLYRIYEEQGYGKGEIPQLILENNIHGLEIDPRAAALAAFALTMKAREYNNRFLNAASITVPKICTCTNYAFSQEEIREYRRLAGSKIVTLDFESTLQQFANADCLGSLIVPSLHHIPEVLQQLRELTPSLANNLQASDIHERAIQLLTQADFLSQKYHVVVTNPPYLNSSMMNPLLKDWVKANYPDYKSDLFAAFVVRCSKLLVPKGQMGFLTPFVWMFISSYEKLRDFVCSSCSINSLIQFEYSALKEATVPICSFTCENSHSSKKGSYFRLTDFVGGMEVQREKMLEAIQNPNCGYFFVTDSTEFKKIPGAPIAYWVGEKVYNLFATNKLIGEIAQPKQGSTLGDNSKFLRLWFEIGKKNEKWFPCMKGGTFRKWYGNLEYVLDWENNGKRVKENGRATIRSEEMLFKQGITWSNVTSGKASFRYMPTGFFFESTGSVCFVAEEKLKSLLAYLNTPISNKVNNSINPTIHLQSGDVAKLPFLFIQEKREKIENIVNASIRLSQTDWDRYETSWNFEMNPFVKKSHDLGIGDLRELYKELRLDWASDTERLHDLEVENNRIFISSYGLDGELTASVPWNEISLTCNPWYRYGEKTAEAGAGERLPANGDLEERLKADTAKELLSYLVGCLMGRYSPDKPGLILANQGDGFARYREILSDVVRTVEIDDDGIIPILDEEWFSDDIVSRCRELIRTIFGESNHMENIRFIEKALGKDLRKYFVKDFYKDHVQRYQKRPIYWLVSSPRGAFNALIYLHRYNKDTVNLVLNKYLRLYIQKLKIQVDNLNIENATIMKTDAAQANRNTRAISKYTAAQKELEDYERDVIFPMAQQPPVIDLDDGVKVNYGKFGNALSRIPGLNG